MRWSAVLHFLLIMLEILTYQETGIGKVVNGFRKGSEVGDIARDLVSKWKSLTAETIEVSKTQERSEKKDRCESNGQSGIRIKKEKDDKKGVKDLLAPRPEVMNSQSDKSHMKDSKEQLRKDLLRNERSLNQQKSSSSVSDKSKEESGKETDKSVSGVRVEDRRVKVESEKEKNKRTHKISESPQTSDSVPDFEAALNGASLVSVKQEKSESTTSSSAKHKHKLDTSDNVVPDKKVKTENIGEKSSSKSKAHKSEHKSKSSSKKHKKDKSSHKHKSKDDRHSSSHTRSDTKGSSSSSTTRKRKAEETSDVASFEEMLSTAKYPSVVKKRKEDTFEDKIAKTVAQVCKAMYTNHTIWNCL